MNDTIITPEFEIVPAEAGLDLTSKNALELAFSGFFSEAAKWKEQAATITDPKLARTARLELKNLRVSAEKKRKELKEDSLRMGKAIDGANNILLATIVPIEKALEDIEKAEERRLAADKAKLVEERQEALRPFLDLSLPLPDVGALTAEQFEKLLADTKFLHDARIAAAKKAEEERAAKEKAEAEERERIRLENERLKKEAAEREAAAKIEREKAEAERKAAEEKARKEKEEIEAKAAADRAKLEAEAKAAREKAEAAERKEREAREKQEAEEKAKREAEEKRIKEEAAAKAKAAKAPDKDKLVAFAASIRALSHQPLATTEGKALEAEIAHQVEKFAAWVEKKAEAL